MWLKSFSILIIASLFGNIAQADVIKVGVQAIHGFEHDMNKWQPTAEYLSQQIPQHVFQILPYNDVTELHADAVRGKFDFILTNPSSYVELEQQAGAQRILTLSNLREGQAYTQYGSVIISRVDNENIEHINDLKGHSFMASSERAFAGWQLARREFQRHGINPYTDFSSLKFGNGDHEHVVHAVKSGLVTAGAIRTGTLERMTENGQIELNNFNILGNKNNKTFPFPHSSELYPEWPLARFKHTSQALANQVAVALMSLPAKHAAAKSGQYAGWVVPMNYQPVHDVLKSLQIGPYKSVAAKVSTKYSNLIHLVERYSIWIASAAIALFSLVLLIWMSVKLQRRTIANMQIAGNKLRTA